MEGGRKNTREEEVARMRCAACRIVELYGTVCTASFSFILVG